MRGRWTASLVVVVATAALVSAGSGEVEAGAPGDSGGRNPGSRIAAGMLGNHTCAVKEDGTVRCWGANDSGQLGNGTGGSGRFSASPVEVGNLSDAVAVSAGASHTCALRAGGGVVCWGSNSSGRLGNGTTTSSPVPVAVVNPDGTALTGVVAITAGLGHTCAVRVDGTVRCWGSNSAGRLGTGNANVPTSSSTALAVANLSDAVSISAGSGHTCAARANGRIRCWGSNIFGQLGIGTSDSFAHATPADVPGLTDISAVAGGGNHTCALRANGTVRCWGFNIFGQLGNGTTVSSPSPVSVSGLGGVVVLVLGSNHSCGRRADGDVRCWGGNDSGQVGDLTKTNRPAPVTVLDFRTLSPTGPPTEVPLLDADGLAAGDRHGCSLQVDDKVRCWGANDRGQLGTGNTNPQTFFTPSVAGSGGTIGARSIAAGLDRACARRADGTAACWDSDLTPAALSGFTRTLAVAAGIAHTCALRSDGVVRCVGSNQLGQIGNGAGGAAAPDVTDPAQGQVSGLADVAALAAGGNFNCALRVTGSVRCWGANAFGQLGNDVQGGFVATRFEPAPVTVQDLDDVVALAAGREHACALRVDGTVHCWGFNGFGQVGAGAASSFVTTPFQVAAISNAVAVAAGPDVSCALLVNGTARCWGKNDVGQLGNNQVSNLPGTPHPTPDDVENLSDAGALAAGGNLGPGTSLSRDFGCARRAGGTVRCWGDNAFGQLGDNSTTDHRQPETTVLRRSPINPCFPAQCSFLVSLAGVTAIAAGDLFGCALVVSGQPFCWGHGNSTIALPVGSFGFNVASAVALGGHDRVAHVTVLANCPEGQQVQITASLTQGEASGKGLTVGACTGTLARYPLLVPADGRSGFVPGPAVVEAEAIIRDRGHVLDEQEWTRSVELAPAVTRGLEDPDPSR